MLQDRSSCDEGNWRSAATRSLTNVAGKCVSVSVFYVHRAGQSALKIYHRLGFAKFGRAYFPKLPGRAALRVRALLMSPRMLLRRRSSPCSLACA